MRLPYVVRLPRGYSLVRGSMGKRGTGWMKPCLFLFGPRTTKRPVYVQKPLRRKIFGQFRTFALPLPGRWEWYDDWNKCPCCREVRPCSHERAQSARRAARQAE